MNRKISFCERNIMEMLRDPLSYIFCLAFPILMLVIMTVVNKSIPEEAGMTVFRPEKLFGGIAVFGQTFIMLFTALTVSKDRSGSFLVRMYATPMTSSDFTAGYILSMLIISSAQVVITGVCSFIISAIAGTTLNIAGILLTFVTVIPSALLFIGIGVLFGSLLNDKAAPGICSIVISLGSFLGSVFFDADNTGGVMLDICRCLPFYYCTKSARAATVLDLSADAFFFPTAIVTVCAAVIISLAVFVFSRKMRADLA